jgi:GntP family gluconate:H+ symporter
LSPLPILAIALAIVIIGVLALRLHAFLTLIVAALAVAALTPAASIERYELTREGGRIDTVAADGASISVTARRGQFSPGVTYDVIRLEQGSQRPHRVGTAAGPVPSPQAGLGAASAPLRTAGQPALPSAAHVGEVSLIVSAAEPGVTLMPGDWVTTAAAVRAATRISADTIGARVAAGFGRTALDIGILIAMASILGGCLMAARGAERIVVSMSRALGPSRTPLAFLGSGFLLGIPMFAEAVFYLLIPLAKAMWMETRRRYVLFVLTIVAGATMTHSLVPPTPGPLFVADAMGIPIALMMQQGAIVAAAAALSGYAYALYADRRWGHEIRPPAASLVGPAGPLHAEASAKAGAGQSHPAGVTSTTPEQAFERLPPLIWSVLPILLPVILISADSALATSSYGLPAWLVRAVRVLGDKNLALTLSAGAALALLWWYAPTAAAVGDGRLGQPSLPSPAPPSRGDVVRKAVRDSVVEAGEIILLIAAGGALGAVLRQAGMAELAAATVPSQKLLLLPIAWGITALVRIAQGSATVAMITAVGIVGPIALAGDLPYHPVYVAVAIGSGSKIGMWMNDSGFWAISRMSGMTEAQTLKTASAMVFVEGCVGLAVTLMLAAAWPLV